MTIAHVEEQQLIRGTNRAAIWFFYGCCALALLSLGISLAGKWASAQLAVTGHSASTRPYEVVIGNNVLYVPENAIRYEHARRGGDMRRLELYLRWPDLEGFSHAYRDDFNHVNGSRKLLFLTFEEQMMSYGMSERFAPIYRHLVDTKASAGPAGIDFYRFRENTGYRNEVLAVARTDGLPFVARCLSGSAARESLAPCERDMVVGDGLSLTYRFPAALLGNWKTLDAEVKKKAASFLKTAR